jgi:hypothetical protein
MATVSHGACVSPTVLQAGAQAAEDVRRGAGSARGAGAPLRVGPHPQQVGERGWAGLGWACLTPFPCVSSEYPSHTLLRHVVSEVQCGMRVGFAPVLTELSVGGAYYMRTRCARIACVYKPVDEEPFASNNPRDFPSGGNGGTGVGIKNGIPVGEAAVRECAAFIIDDGFARVRAVPSAGSAACIYALWPDHKLGWQVPATVMARVTHPLFGSLEKIGSLQAYVRNVGSSDDYGPSKFCPEDALRIMSKKTSVS